MIGSSFFANVYTLTLNIKFCSSVVEAAEIQHDLRKRRGGFVLCVMKIVHTKATIKCDVGMT
jgi:hypothetical protein